MECAATPSRCEDQNAMSARCKVNRGFHTSAYMAQLAVLKGKAAQRIRLMSVAFIQGPHAHKINTGLSFGWIVFDLGPGMLTPISHGLSQFLVRFGQTIWELESRWNPPYAFRWKVLLNGSDLDHWPTVCKCWIFWNQAIIQGFCICTQKWIHPHLTSKSWFSIKQLSQHQVREATSVCSFIACTGFRCKCAAAYSLRSARLPVHEEAIAGLFTYLSRANHYESTELRFEVASIRPACITVGNQGWGTVQGHGWIHDSTVWGLLGEVQAFVEHFQVVDIGVSALVWQRSWCAKLWPALSSQPLKASTNWSELLALFICQLQRFLKSTSRQWSRRQLGNEGFLRHSIALLAIFFKHCDLLPAVLTWRLQTHMSYASPLKHVRQNVHLESLGVGCQHVVHMDDEEAVQEVIFSKVVV